MHGIYLALSVCALAYFGAQSCAHAQVSDREAARINRQVNHEFPSGAPTTRGDDGVWDCEDYANEKRVRLLAAGVPGTAVKLWSVTTRWGERHAVLELRQPGGSVILDNLDPWPIPMAEARERYSEWHWHLASW